MINPSQSTHLQRPATSGPAQTPPQGAAPAARPVKRARTEAAQLPPDSAPAARPAKRAKTAAAQPSPPAPPAPDENLVRTLKLVRAYMAEHNVSFERAQNHLWYKAVIYFTLKEDPEPYPRKLPDLRELEQGEWWNEPGALPDSPRK